MNSKKLKELRRKTKQLQIEWLKSLVSEEEGEGINLKTLKSLLPKQTHFYAMVTGSNGQEHRCIRLSYMTSKWIMKILKLYPHIRTIGELNEVNDKRKQVQRNNNNLWMNSY